MTHCKNQNYKDSKKVSGCLGMLKNERYLGPKNFFKTYAVLYDTILTDIYTVIDLSKPTSCIMPRANPKTTMDMMLLFLATPSSLDE